VTIQLAKGRDLLIVTQVETVNAFLPLRDDLVKTGYAAYIIELLDRFTYEEQGGDPAVFKLLVETLGRIEKETEAWLAIRYYEMRLLDAVGFRPQLFECVNCGREDIGRRPVFFRLLREARSAALRTRPAQPYKISVETLKYFASFSEIKLPKMPRGASRP